MDCPLLAFPTSVEEIRIQQMISGHTISQSQRTFSLLRRCGAVVSSCVALHCDSCDSFNVLFTCILRILHYKALNATVSFQFSCFGLHKVWSLEGLFRIYMHKQRLSFRAAMTPPSTMASTATSWTLRSTHRRATALC